MAGPLNGLLAKAYYSSNGVAGAGWTALNIIGDVQINASRANSPVKERASDFEKTIAGQVALEATFTMTRRTNNAQYEALRDAFLNNTSIGVAFMTGAINTNGSEGWQFDAVVTDFPIGEPLDDASTIEVTVKPALSSNTEPDYVEIGA